MIERAVSAIGLRLISGSYMPGVDEKVHRKRPAVQLPQTVSGMGIGWRKNQMMNLHEEVNCHEKKRDPH